MRNEIDESLGERFYKGQRDLEEKHIADITEMIRRAIEKRVHPDGRRPAKRDAHAFDNGCVRAFFRVDSNLPPDLQHGVFVPGREYPAWIRFSNGNSERRSSRWPDARGMAIKLMSVPGEKLMDDEKETQDFILISHPVFFVDDLERYKALLELFLRGGVFDQFVRSLLKLRWRERWLALVANLHWISNPLFQRYWSMTPYQLGIAPGRKFAVKYSARPRLTTKPTLISRLAVFFGRNFSLKQEVNDTLKTREMRFDFGLQRFVDERTPIEDTTIEWKEKVAKFEHVATIIIPSQDIMSAAQNDFCENLSFSPWHGLPEHRPLGLTNRVRKVAYLAISNHRHKLNGVPPMEPKGHEEFGKSRAPTDAEVLQAAKGDHRPP